MYSQRKFGPRMARKLQAYAAALVRIFVAFICVQPALLHAQNAPPGAIARIEGEDISIEGGSAAIVPSPAGGPNYVFNGSILTVHTGRAKLTFAAGGEVEIC